MQLEYYSLVVIHEIHKIGGQLMRAIVYHDYGDPKKVMKLNRSTEVSNIKDDEVLVKVESSSINAADKHMVRANYLIVRIMLGFFRPRKRNRILGEDLAGVIHSKGKLVNNFGIGEAVVADVRKKLGGGFAEFAVVNVKDLVRKPKNVSFNQAATVPISGQAAMMGLIQCQIKSGDKILINGASGGVGSFGVQIAKALGAHVTAYSSENKISIVKSWGADEVLDYKTVQIDDLEEKSFDAILDTACFDSPQKFNKVLKDDGRYVLVGGSYYNMLKVKFFGRFYTKASQHFKVVTQEVSVTTNIKRVLEMIAKKEVKPAIQSIVSLKEVPNALSILEQRKVVGKIVVNNQR